MSQTATAPHTGSLPRQRPQPSRPTPTGPGRGPRHRDLVAAAELEHEPAEDWTAMCAGRRCSGACVVWRAQAAMTAAVEAVA